MSCSLLEVYIHFEAVNCLYLKDRAVLQQETRGSLPVFCQFLVLLCFDSEDGGSMFLQNISKLLLGTQYHIH